MTLAGASPAGVVQTPLKVGAPDTVVCWRWRPRPGYRSVFGPDTVNTLRSMVARHFPRPHRFVCFTDDVEGLDPRVDVRPLPQTYGDLPSPHGGKNPSCYRRLAMFRRDAAATFGDRFVSLDLDCVITADLTPLWDRAEEIVLWGDTNPQPGSHYNGSMMLIAAGARPQVWETFDPKRSPQQALAARAWGSDQGWISYCLGAGEKRWTKQDGVYSFRNHLQPRPVLPENARIVLFHGNVDPWAMQARDIPWIQEHYR